MSDFIAWVIIFAAIGFMFFMAWAVCSMARRWDDIEEEYWSEYWGEDGVEDD